MARLIRGGSGEPIIVIGGDSSSTYNSFGKKTSTEKQSAVVVDILSEGPIKGLVDGASSVQLNGVPILDPITKQSYSAAVSSNVSYTASSRTITDNNSTLFANRGTADGTYKIQIEGGLKTASGLISTTAGLSTVTASSSFFAADQVSFNNESRTLTIPGAGAGGSDYKGRIVEFINATSVSVEPAPSVSVSGANASIDLVGTISTISNNTATLVGSGTLGINKANVKANLSTPGVSASTTSDRWNFEDAGFAFRSGTRDQSVLALPGNVGTNSLTTNAGVTLNTTNFNAITHNGSAIFPSDYVTANGVSNWGRISEPDASRLVYTSDGMGVPSPGEVDAIKVTIKFPNGMLGQKPGDGAEEAGFAEFQILFEYSVTGNFDDTKTYVAYGHSDAQLAARVPKPGRSADDFGGHAGKFFTTGTVSKKTKTAFVQTFSWSVSSLQPFTKYRIKISKITPTNGFNERRYWYNATQLQSIQNIITDKTSYPYTAYAATIFGAKDFSSPPRRGFEIRGLQVKVPTNYFSRHELGEGSQPSYTRKVTNNITTTNETEYQDWDGNFRGDIKTFTNPNHSNYATVWTDNPVWILLDILTNDRYGLGKFVDPLDDFSYIDKFQLFQIAKYCDELVPDGKGGLEPRFTANLYLSKMEEAQKVVRDLLSIFRGLLIWFDGKFTPTINAYKSPIYTFTKGNVVAGEFSYQSTSSRFRSNQVRVTWNNPEDNYTQDVEVVEDTQNILESSKIISKDVTATGCTSQGQAHRFGKWHLLTEKLEKEIVSFSTGLNAIALRPGDVIEIQDADLNETEHSGRVSNTGTRNTTVIPLDREISLNTSTKAYKLNLIFPKGGAYLSQDKATINSTDYVLGDLVLLDESAASIDTQEKASNVKDDSDNLVQLFWSDSVRVESKPVGTFTSTSVTVTSAFSETPDAEVIWSLSSTLIATGQEEENITPKEYIIINTEEKEKNIIVLSAVEYSKEKFELVDRGYVTEIVSEHQKPPLKSDIVPQVESLTASVSTSSIETSNTTATNGRADLLISWQPPVQIRQSTESTISGAVNNSTSVTLSSSNTIIDVGMRVRHSSISGVVTVSAIDGTALTLSSAVTLSSGVELSFKHDIPDENIIGYNVKVVGPETNDMADWETRGNAYFKFVTAEDTTTSLKGIVEGTYYVHIKAVNIIQNLSAPSTVRINYTAQKYSVPTGQNKLLGIDKGGVLDKALTINSGSGNAIIASNTYSFTHSNGTIFHNTSNNAETYQQSFSELGSSSVGYLLYDHGSSDTLKAVQIYEDDTATDIDGNKLNIEYWKEVDATNNGLTTKTGTVSITDSSATLTGSSTAFTTEFDEGDFIVLGAGSTAFYAYINFIESDTIMDLDRVPTRNYSGTTIKKLSYVPNYAEDQILAKIATDGSTTYSIEDTYAITAGLDGAASAAGEDARSVKLTASSFVVRYNTSDTVTSNNITFTTDGQGTGSNAQTFRFLTKESGESSFTQRQAFSSTSTFTLADSEEPAIGGETQIKVEMNEAGSSSNPVASDTVTVYAIQDGAASAAGDDAVTAFLTNAAHVISTNSAGSNPSYTTAGGLFDVFVGADRRTLHNDVDFYAGATGTSTSLTQNGLTLTFNNTDGNSAKGTYTLSGSSWSTDSESFTVRAVLASSVPGISSAVTITRIYSISKSKTGVDGATGNEVAEIRIYYKQNYATTVPSTPSGGTYNFATKVFTPPSGWSTTLPTTNFLEIVYSSVATATGASTATSVTPGTFSIPSIQIGVTPTTNYIFKRSDTQPTKPSPADYQTIPNTWEDDIANVGSGTDPIWSSFGKATFSPSNRTFITTWQDAVQQEGSAGAPGNPGAPGDDGASNFTVFQESSSAPDTPTPGNPNPPTSSWYSTLGDARAAVSGNGLVWFSVGTKPGTSNTITWSTPIRYVEDYGNLGGTKPPEDANKVVIGDSTDGRFSININDAGLNLIDVYDSGEKQKINRLQAGKLPDSDTLTIEDSTASQAKATAAETAAKLQESTNRVTFPSNSTEGQFSFKIGVNDFTNNVFSPDERTKLNNLRAGTLPGGTGSLESTSGSQAKATAAEDAAKLQESTNRVTFPSNSTEGQFSFKIGTDNFTNNVFSPDERVKLNNLRSGLDPIDGTNSIRNNAIDVTFASNTLTLTGIGTTNTASLTKGTLGLSYADGATVGAVAGVNLKDSSDNTLSDADVRNDDLQIDYQGTTVRIKKGSNTIINSQAAPTGLKNDQVVLSSGGTLSYSGGTNQTLDLDNITDTGDTKTGALKAEAGLDSSGNLTAGIKSGSTTFTAAEAINVRAGFDSLSTTPILKVANANSGLKNATININSSGQITGINSSANNKRIHNDIIEIDLATSGANQGRISLIGIGSTNTTVDVTKGNLGLSYDDGATVGAVLGSNLKAANGTTTLGDNDVKNAALDVDIDGTSMRLKIGSTVTSTVTATQGLVGLSGVSDNADQTSSNTAADVTNVNGTAAATVKAGAVRANAGLTSTGVVNKIVPKEKGGLAEDISNKTGVLDFSSGTANFRATLPTNRGGFGLNVANLFGSTVGRLPRWNGTAFVSAAENDFKNSELSALNITDGLGFTPGTSNFSGNVQDLGGTTLDAAKVPIDDSNFFKVDSGEIKFGDTINYTGYITAGSGTKKAGLVGSGTNADATVRIFAGQSFGNRNSAPFRVTQGGEVNVTSFNVNTGASSTNLRFRPGDASGYFFSVGNSADPSSAPMRARSVSGSSHIELQNVKIFKSDGSTLMFDSEEGFTSAAYTDIASNVGTSDTGSSVSTATITNLINPFTLTGGANSTVTTPSSQQKRFTKVTLTSSKVLIFKVIKDGSMDGLALGTGADAAAKAKIPTNVKMRLMHSTNSNLSGASQKAVLGSSFSAGVSRTETSPSATQYQISKTVDDTTPGFEIVEYDTLNGASDALAATGNFEITDSDTYASGDHYFFVEIDGSAGEGAGSGANDITFTAPRTLEISGSGDFSVDSSGNIQPAGSTRVSADSTFTNNKLLVGVGGTRSVESSSGLTYSSSILTVTGTIKATADVVAYHSSDARLKDNVTVINSALAKVKQLRGVEFDWNDKQDTYEGHDIGVIAQEVEQVAPELVKDREDGYKAVDYPKLTALLIEAVKELELKVKELEDKQK